jgi:hypothetical protein
MPISVVTTGMPNSGELAQRGGAARVMTPPPA